MASDRFSAWFTKVHRFAFHHTGGRIGGKLGRIPMALMYTIGAKSGEVRMIPLQCYPVEPEGVLVLASNNGQPRHPSWYYNLKAHPELDALVGRDRRRVRAEELHAERRALEWPRMLEQNPAIEDYKARAGGREIPIFLLRTLTRQQR
jgi:deazaflavin-dependent oxidoreductase (nitroreductase family)